MRQIVLDTETTGLEAAQGHRIIEVGCIELINRRHTGRHFHRYLNPERDIDAGASAVHGLSRERLATAPKFAAIAAELIEFIAGSELVIHNAPFDVAFLDMELALLAKMAAVEVAAGAAALAPAPAWPAGVRTICQVLDTLALARARHPGQRNSLDALCKRYGVDNAHRELHGALLDARLLADVYLAMTGGQSLLALDVGARAQRDAADGVHADASGGAAAVGLRPAVPLRVIEPTAEELAAHLQLTQLLQKASAGQCVWLEREAEAQIATTGDLP
ncbi:MAG TPA: DNA polymerase III subunit epsilon [Steroidobacteraceae bacterium]|jgi:DNA polymerase-3 subunit epsilon|nr:DNA polymerase III subunit epsilon [Steroidobacteraceae bacterium]